LNRHKTPLCYRLLSNVVIVLRFAYYVNGQFAGHQARQEGVA